MGMSAVGHGPVLLLSPRPPVACKLVGERGLLILYFPPEDNFPLAIFSKSFS